MKKIVLLAAAVLATLVVTAAPAVAAQKAASGSVACNSWQGGAASTFDSLGSLLAADSAARGAGEVGREPSLNEKVEALPDSAKGKAGKNFKANVPVWFHVITDGATGALTNSQIAAQISVLNLGFAGFYGGAKSGYAFTLAGTTRTNNSTWFNARAGGDAERDMKRALHKGGFETLNIYTNLAGGYLGYAYLPGLPDSRLYIDGIVMHWATVPGASTQFAGRYDLGYTLIHEAGHWVDLEHTFFGGCNAKGDFVDDTPAMLVPTNGCPEGKDTCSDPGLDPIHNYMDYSYDSCYTQFTPGQVARAQDSWLYFRAA